jgi:hypothetical protein
LIGEQHDNGALHAPKKKKAGIPAGLLGWDPSCLNP